MHLFNAALPITAACERCSIILHRLGSLVRLCRHLGRFARAFPVLLGILVYAGPAVYGQLRGHELALPSVNMQAVLKQAGLQVPFAQGVIDELSEEIGPRLTGSNGDRHAADWALGKMRALGLSHVHAEPWQLDRGWQRGHAELSLLTPFRLPLAGCSYGWTGSTAGPVQAELIAVSIHDRPRARAWRGKVLLVDPGKSTAESADSFFAVAGLVKTALSHRAVAVLIPDQRPGVVLPHTSPLSFPGETSTLPVLAIAAEHAALLKRLLSPVGRAASPRPRVELEVSNEFTTRPVSSQNIVGEIPGTDARSEIVVLGAHLDSWDLSPGITDDGYGVAVVLAAARGIVASGAAPRRTLRFILFSGEEQGLLGSRTYVRAHRDESGKLVCAIVLDWGDGIITSLPVAGHAESEGPLRALLDGAGYHDQVAVTPGYLTYTDAFSFSMAGVAGFAPLQDSPDYSRIAHSSADTREHVNTATLGFNTALAAALAYGIAEIPDRVARRWTPEQTRTEMARIKTPLALMR